MSEDRQFIIQDAPFNGKSVVYIMSRDQRVEDNHALILAQNLAIAKKVPLYVLFVLMEVKSRSYEHYEFMLEGLSEVASSASKYNISFVMRAGHNDLEILRFVQEVGCGALFFDFSPLKHARSIAKKVANHLKIPISVVDTHNIIPLWIASSKQEYAAHTMRRKVHQNLAKFLVAPSRHQKHPYSAEPMTSISPDIALQFISKIPKSGIKISQKSGENSVRKHLQTFIKNSLDTYALQRND
ncbi:deoxyribodipyrimidine photo-lyase, partial [Candidatus Saccharibacteria bacterium]|nr:deoxyribodipyrimidine photo-lyase [Candidatus Saccharibacteria bacterium]